MGKKVFMGKPIEDNQDIFSLLGPSGTGKSFSAEFLHKYMGYRVARQITTRDPRPDDTHYDYMSRADFIKAQDDGRLLGYFSGDREKLSGNGYGYLLDGLYEELDKYGKIILFPSAYELLLDYFQDKYGNTAKVGLAYKDSRNMIDRTFSAKKEMSTLELEDRICVGKTLSGILSKYNVDSNDQSFHLIYTDALSSNIETSKKIQLCRILSHMGYNTSDTGVQKAISEYIMER